MRFQYCRKRIDDTEVLHILGAIKAADIKIDHPWVVYACIHQLQEEEESEDGEKVLSTTR